MGLLRQQTGIKRCAAMAEAKTWVWEEFGEAMENDFWITIRHLRVGKHYTVNTVYSGHGVLLTSTKDQWREYFDRPPQSHRLAFRLEGRAREPRDGLFYLRA